MAGGAGGVELALAAAKQLPTAEVQHAVVVCQPAVHRPRPLLQASPGPAGAANNLAGARQQRRRIADGAAEGVGAPIYVDKVESEMIRRPRYRDNIEASMLDATRMISGIIALAQLPPPPVDALPNVAPLPPPAGDTIESLYRRLASARVANRDDAVLRYERMIDSVERREEEELINNHHGIN